MSNNTVCAWVWVLVCGWVDRTNQSNSLMNFHIIVHVSRPLAQRICIDNRSKVSSETCMSIIHINSSDIWDRSRKPSVPQNVFNLPRI